ncbi:epsin-2 [Morus notabilis]|uniref:epsin-2 n=1 Tax=Morus notabilis TaxID=981085 RepID=UPI000CED3CEC|nr:epsin-2 [Morus notabilis]
MGTLLMDHIKKQASSFLQDKYKSARLALTDVTEAEVLAELATNSDQCSPNARTMTIIAEASYGVDDYWRIVDLLHRRLYCVDWKQWRQAYKSLILLEFLLTHGPEDFAEEFVCDTDVIHELGTFQYIDDKGFNWGYSMQRKSEEILKLLGAGKKVLKEARLRALKVTREIQGFGSSTSPVSPSSSSPSPSSCSASESSRNSSFGSFSTSDMNNEMKKIPQFLTTIKDAEGYSQGGIRDDDIEKDGILCSKNKSVEGLHIWDCPSIQGTGCFLEGKDEEDYYEDEKGGGNYNGFVGGIFSKLSGLTGPSRGGNGFRSVSDVGREVKKFNRQFSLWY